MAANRPILPRPPFAPGTYPGVQSRDLERELSNQRAALQKLFEGRADGVLALDAPPAGTWEQGALVRAADPIRTISASTTWVVLGWLRANEGLGTLTWQELRIWETAGGGGGGGFAATSMTATTTGVGTAVYAGNPAGELLFRNLQAGSGISVTTSAGAIRITNTSAAGGFAATSQTATSTGTGVDVYVGNPAGELTFRKVQAGANISVTTSAGAIRITSTGGGLTAASITATNTGSGESVYAGNSGTELVFRKLQEGTGISLTQSAGAVKITATRYGSQIGTYGWRDNLAPLQGARAAGANQPTWGTIRDGLSGWLFSPVTEQELWISFHIDHDYAAGTALFPHIHVVPLDNTGGVTRWGIEYSFAKGHNQAAFGPSTTIYIDGTITASSQYRHYIFETSTLSAISGADIETDGVLLCRIFRNVSDPGDTFSTTVAAIFADLHYQTDHIATLEKAAPFTALSWNGDTTIGGFLATSQTATSTGTGVAVYVGNAAGELTLRKVQAGTGISITTSGGAIRITGTGGGGGNSITTTAVASAPSGTVAGTLFLPRDHPLVGVATGTGYNRWGPLVPCVEVPDTGWTRLGFTASFSVIHEFGTARFYSPPVEGGNADAGSYLFYERNRTASVSNTWMVTAIFADVGRWLAHAGSGRFGIYIGDSATSKAAEFAVTVATAGAYTASHRNYTSITSSQAIVLGLTITAATGLVWSGVIGLRMRQTLGTLRRQFYLTTDGIGFTEIFSQSITSSASLPATFDKVGIVFNTHNSTAATVNRQIRLISWKEN